MPTDIIRTRVQVFRRANRLAWLESPAPAYGETLAWLHRQPYQEYPADPGGAVDGRPRIYSPQPSYSEHLPWRRRPAQQPSDAEEQPGLRAWRPYMTTAAAPVVEQLPWLRRTRPVEEQPAATEPGQKAWTAAMPILDPVPWLQSVRPAEERAVEDPGRRAWSPSMPMLGQTPWLRRRVAELQEQEPGGRFGWTVSFVPPPILPHGPIPWVHVLVTVDPPADPGMVSRFAAWLSPQQQPPLLIVAGGWTEPGRGIVWTESARAIGWTEPAGD